MYVHDWRRGSRARDQGQGDVGRGQQPVVIVGTHLCPPHLPLSFPHPRLHLLPLKLSYGCVQLLLCPSLLTPRLRLLTPDLCLQRSVRISQRQLTAFLRHQSSATSQAGAGHGERVGGRGWRRQSRSQFTRPITQPSMRPIKQPIKQPITGPKSSGDGGQCAVGSAKWAVRREQCAVGSARWT